jgi:hypothetical protein
MFYGETSAMCEFCNRVHDDNCDFDFDDRLYIKDVVRKIQSNRDLGITLLWRSNGPKANLEYFN